MELREDTRLLGPFAFRFDHPQASVDVLLVTSEKRHPVVPQFLKDPPIRPSSSASPAYKEAYAEFALGNFVSDRRTDLVGDTLWDLFLDWEAKEKAKPTSIGRIALRMIDNLNRHVLGKERQREARKIQKLKVNQLGKRLRDLMGQSYSKHNSGESDSDDGEDDEQTWASVRNRTFEEEEADYFGFILASGKFQIKKTIRKYIDSCHL